MLGVDDEFELGRLQERQISRLGAFEATRCKCWISPSPRHARADIALEGNARLSADRSQVAGIAIDADVARQLAGDATAAFERGAAVAPCLNADAVERHGVEAIGAPPHVALR